MAMKMKGLLKGLRFITQIFDDEKEPEMQIGYPTDVKHVAHFGSDDPSAMTPSWMNEFKARELENGSAGSKRNIKKQESKFTPEGKNQAAGIRSQELRPGTQNEKQKHKTQRKPSIGSLPLDSPGSLADVRPRQTRRHHGSHDPTDSSSPGASSSQRKQHNRVPDLDSSHNSLIETFCPHTLPSFASRSVTHRKSNGSSEGESPVKTTGTCPLTDIGKGIE